MHMARVCGRVCVCVCVCVCVRVCLCEVGDDGGGVDDWTFLSLALMWRTSHVHTHINTYPHTYTMSLCDHQKQQGMKEPEKQHQQHKEDAVSP
jgi:hypothetical protein